MPLNIFVSAYIIGFGVISMFSASRKLYYGVGKL